MSKGQTVLGVRISQDMKKKFNRKAGRFGNVSEVHREIIQAFIDGRLIIEPNPNQPLEGLYNVYREKH